MKTILLLLGAAFLSGCCAIGIETVGVREVPASKLSIRNREVQASTNANEIIKMVGLPDERGTNYLRYSTGRWGWRGIVVDAAIFPVPLTIPLIVPTGKVYVDFVSNEHGTHVVQRRTTSRFYGYGASDAKSGFVWGTESGFWFNPEP